MGTVPQRQAYPALGSAHPRPGPRRPQRRPGYPQPAPGTPRRPTLFAALPALPIDQLRPPMGKPPMGK